MEIQSPGSSAAVCYELAEMPYLEDSEVIAIHQWSISGYDTPVALYFLKIVHSHILY
jgi:hypothetical protein